MMRLAFPYWDGVYALKFNISLHCPSPRKSMPLMVIIIQREQHTSDDSNTDSRRKGELCVVLYTSMHPKTIDTSLYMQRTHVGCDVSSIIDCSTGNN